ncbi:MAG: apolipoprotein N-acyltransferase [Gammaproteobacteria bacterium RIFCSPHIGHO2_02_FULL_42_13]|nr:MAG: apolipoprotein N-acyltransferase [Gammaproteobacteria bacterium RIFCSPHIGHO2_02_FULL_42_13]OGT70868.1 MAG: apolipoprotein N-acyltransferase [Gammaproteobacteria bacterium RIFCSPLOWO2_02_FULL_42_9]
MPKQKAQHIINCLISLFAGAILPLAFAPLNLYWIAPISLALLLKTILNKKPFAAGLYGLLFGFGLYGVGIPWVFISMHQYGGQGVIVSTLFTFLFILLFAFFIALRSFCFRKFLPLNTLSGLLLGFPACWILVEWITGWLFTGFPWLFLGYSQTNSWLGGYAPLFGVYGSSFMVVLSASLLVILFFPNGIERKHFMQKTLRYLSVLLLLSIWIGGGLLDHVHWTKPIDKPIKVTLIQGNIPQHVTWSPDDMLLALHRYNTLTNQHWNSDLIVWPEAAIPTLQQEITPYLNSLATKAKVHHTTILLGIPVKSSDNKFYNAAVAIGASTGRYDKRHLVPWGEYLPFESIMSKVFHALGAPVSLFTHGQSKQNLIPFNHVYIAPYICYEIAYAGLVQGDLPQANLLVTITNDIWFGKSWAAAQHLQIGQMRSLETGRYTLFVGNNGITAIITPKGNIINRLPRFQTAALTDQVYAMEGTTPWIFFGTWPMIVGLFLLWLVAVIRQRYK